MPLLTRLLIKSSLVYLVAALLLGAGLALAPLVELPLELSGTFPVYIHLIAVGWITQLIFGVVYWMFPKASREQPRGSESLAWWTFSLLNAGLVLRVFAEPAAARDPGGVWGWILAASALLQWIAGTLFVWNTWNRVKEK